ncbi:MAG TPA: glycoside hydrolase family 2 TIM barrel-domain containing protein [Terriglobia bacterium]|nr:glycoside hydrolase family 2 TIM barrel-domain containing protein [Terriglobia bacterium]
MKISRRDFVRSCSVGAATFVSDAMLAHPNAAAMVSAGQTDPAHCTLSLDRDWLFGGKLSDAALQPGFNDAAFTRITLPHCVAKLSWQKWDPAQWEDVWIYRRHFVLPNELRSRRIFLCFDGVMVGATPVVNGHILPRHLGGYLPFQYEITNLLAPNDNVLAVAIDSRWSNVPPEGSPRGPQSIDYLEPGGIDRPVSLRAAPQIFISDVFAKPVKVLDADRRVEVTCSIDAAVLPSRPIRIEAALMEGARVLARASRSLSMEKTGESQVALTLSNLGNVALWDVDRPRLYDIVVTLSVNAGPVHDYRVRMGFRDARFEVDGFFLNGQRLQLFGLDRHELFPYVGFAMPRRVLRRDAEILRHDFNCNFVRCSHYPQSEAFLEACDELGLMVWEETPGWGYLGDEAWKDLVVRDVKGMVCRDRNHPSVVIWGVRVNESKNDQSLYQRTTKVAKSLDGSRPTSGSMTSSSRKNWEQEWHEDVFAFDDYHAAPDGSVGIEEPVPGVPYMLAEAVGQFNYSNRKGFDAKYRRAGDVTLQQQQALRHAQAHNNAAAYPHCSGVVAWCAFDYGSLVNSFDGVKCPGVADVFRISKLGASFYLAQVDPRIRPVIEPNFYWDFGPQTPSGPGKKAAIFSNCDRLELFINGNHHASVQPDLANFPHLKHSPFFANLEHDGARHPELRIDGYVGQALVLSRSFSSDPSKDRLLVRTDDAELIADGSDATRLVFWIADRFGATRPFVDGTVTLQISGPGVIVGDNPFQLADGGGAGAVWIKTLQGQAGRITVVATRSPFSAKSVEIDVSI